MQGPTCTGLRIRNPQDAHVVFHAVMLEKFAMVHRRLDSEERRQIAAGHIYVWEEKGSTSGSGIERWTDSVRWGPSRCRDEFLFYQEKDSESGEVDGSDTSSSSGSAYGGHLHSRQRLVKQTYSVHVHLPGHRVKKWHLIAYFTHESIQYLKTVDEVPILAHILVPEHLYKSARSAKGRLREPRVDTFAGKSSTHPSVALFPHPYNSETLLRTLPPGQGDRVSSARARQVLAPLVYLQTTPPHRRHPVDEEALMSFTPGLLS
ncbi:Gti1/Pac2 family-domain-containing protein [Flagelloscypha sp. PMI_526]|nr:Gti1/Pac2 family-domain-containing protein [Flagelloscypha sp. PMI_526]